LNSSHDEPRQERRILAGKQGEAPNPLPSFRKREDGKEKGPSETPPRMSLIKTQSGSGGQSEDYEDENYITVRKNANEIGSMRRFLGRTRKSVFLRRTYKGRRTYRKN